MTCIVSRAAVAADTLGVRVVARLLLTQSSIIIIRECWRVFKPNFLNSLHTLNLTINIQTYIVSLMFVIYCDVTGKTAGDV